MKALFKIVFFFFIAAALFGCGNATEVGNPTGDVPVLTTVKGTIDLSSITPVVDPLDLTVVASATDGTAVESAVEPGGDFSLDLAAGKTYSMYVRTAEEVIGPFSFEQDDHGNRANRLVVTEELDPVDMGQVRFQNNAFYPEDEPRRQMGNGQMGNN